MNEIEVASRFFYTGGALPPEAPSYIQRAADDQLFERLLHGDYCYVLVSRQMGKSSLMVHTLTRLLQQNLTAVMVDLNSIGDDTTQEQWYYSLTEQLAGQLGLTEQIDAFWDRSESKTALQKWVGAVEQLVCLHPDHSLVIFIDEIDQVRSLSFKTDEFFAAIRSFHNRRALDPNFKRLTFCLIGVALPSDLIEDPRITPFNIAERIDLTDFTEDQVVALKTGLQRDEIQDEVLLQRVFYWTNGHPYLTQRLCRAIVEDATVQAAQDVDKLCGRLFFGKDAVAPDDNINLVSARLLHSDTDVVGLLTLYQRIAQGKSVHYDRANRLINVLMLAGSIRPVGGNLHIRNRIYAQIFDAKWIADNMPYAEQHRLSAARRKGRLQVIAIALPIILLLSFLTIMALSYARQAREATQKARQATGRSNSLLYISDMNQIQQIWDNMPDSKRVQELLNETAKITDSNGELCKGFEWNYWKRKASIFSGKIPIYTSDVIGHQFPLPVTCLAISPNGKIIGIGDIFGNVRLLDAETTGEILTLKGHGVDPSKLRITAMAFSPDGLRIVTASEDGTTKMWNVRTEKEIFTLQGHKKKITSVAFSPDGQHIVSASGNSANVWNAKTRKGILTLRGHRLDVLCVAFSPDGQQLVTGSSDKTAKIWDAKTGKSICTLMGHGLDVASVAFSPNGRRIVSASGRTASVWDAKTGKEILVLKDYASWAGFSSDGQSIITGSPATQNIRVWNAKTGDETLILKGPYGGVRCLALFPDGKRIITMGDDGNAVVRNIQSGYETILLKKGGACASFSPDGRRIGTAGRDKTAKVWDAKTGNEIFTLKGHTRFVWPIVFSPDGQYIVTGSEDHTARVWDAKTGKGILILNGHEDRVGSVAFSPDGKRIVTGSGDHTAKVWDAKTGKEILTLKGHRNEVYVAFFPDGKRIVTGSMDNTARVWDAKTGKEMFTIQAGKAGVSCMAISSDGKSIATGSSDGNIIVWDAKTGKEIRSFKGHDGGVMSVAFLPRSHRIVTGSEDQTAKIWDTNTGKEILTLKGHRNIVSSVAISPDGKSILTGSYDGTARVWDGKED